MLVKDREGNSKPLSSEPVTRYSLSGLQFTRTARDYDVSVVRGVTAILRMQPKLCVLAGRAFEPGAVDDLGYLLMKPGYHDTLLEILKVKSDTPWILRKLVGLVAGWNFIDREAVLLYASAAKGQGSALSPDAIMGAMLLLEYRVCGIRTGLLATNDRSGRSTFISPRERRSDMLSAFGERLLQESASIILITFKEAYGDLVAPVEGNTKRATWKMRSREAASYLPLGPTMLETMARIGPATRKSLRRHRKKADAELGCKFIANVQLTEDEFVEFNRICMYAPKEEIARWRYRSLAEIKNPVLAGLQNQKGEWLSIVCARRQEDGTEILWQMNSNDYPEYSLVNVMRLYLMEHEVPLGQKRLYVEGGTLTSMHHSFVKQTFCDLLVIKRSFRASLICKAAVFLLPRGNDLGHMLSNPKITEGQPGYTTTVEEPVHLD